MDSRSLLRCSQGWPFRRTWAQIDAAEVKTGEAQTIETNPTALAAGAGSVQLTITNPDGVKEAEAGLRKVRITEDPQKGIKIERTTKQGRQRACHREFSKPKMLKELEKKSPEGFKLYQQELRKPGAVPGIVILGVRLRPLRVWKFRFQCRPVV